MKKLIAVMLVIAMAFAAVSALADEAADTEESYATYFMVGVVDPEGNAVTITDTADFPILVFMIATEEDKDGTRDCYFGTEDGIAFYSCETIEAEEDTMMFRVFSANSEDLYLIYSIEDDIVAYVSEDGYTYMLMNAEEINAAAVGGADAAATDATTEAAA